MEHKLIQGGESYLAFARSRIKALRATGARYATQRFVMPGGEQVMVRLSGDHDYIEIKGGGGSVSMDSGVVDVGSIALGNPATWLDGVLLEYGSAQAYNAQFLAYVTNPPGRTVPKPVPPSSAGRIAGILTRTGQFNGRILDIPESFRRGNRAVTPATDPPTTEPDPEDAALVAKKTLSVLCPASIFTGRCRMYVQAMYGLRLHARSNSGRQTGTATIPTIVSETSAAPALLVAAYEAAAGDAEQTVQIDTSTGVWLDTSDGRHWLFQLSNGSVHVYPLMTTSPFLEACRKYLKAGADVDGMTADDLEHLEAYILAYSLPDANNKQAAGTYTCGSYSMGYGWHWNWDATAADIVVNEQVAQSGGLSTDGHMRSSHYRLSITKTLTPEGAVPQTWDSQVVTIEGPSDWTVQRSSWQIAEPNYADFILTKSTPKTTQMFEGDAPFYAFYVRNTLNVCRVSVVERFGHPAEVVENNVFGAALVTTGLTEGDRRTYTVGGNYFEATFSCGNVTTPPLDTGHSVPYSRVQVHEKTKNSWIAGYGSSGGGSWNTLVSDDFGTSYVYEMIVDTLTDDRQTNNTTHKVTGSTVNEAHEGSAQIIVPFYDSEAVFIRAERTITSNTTASSTTNYQHSLLGEIGAFLSRTAFLTQGYRSRALSCGALPASSTEYVSGPFSNPDSAPVTNVSLQEIAVIRGSSCAATFSNLSEFLDNSSDSVGALYVTVSGSRDVDPVGLSTQLNEQVGANGLAAAVAPVIVGWV